MWGWVDGKVFSDLSFTVFLFCFSHTCVAMHPITATERWLAWPVSLPYASPSLYLETGMWNTCLCIPCMSFKFQVTERNDGKGWNSFSGIVLLPQNKKEARVFLIVFILSSLFLPFVALLFCFFLGYQHMCIRIDRFHKSHAQNVDAFAELMEETYL